MSMPALRFKSDIGQDFSAGEIKPLGEVASLFNGRAYKQTEWKTEGTPVIRLQNLTGSSNNYYYSDIRLPENQYCNKGDLLYMWSATFGPVWWKGDKAIYHYHIWKIETDATKLSKQYLYYVLDNITAKMKSTSNGSTMDHITKGGMEKHDIYLPYIDEQTKIASFLTAVDEKITQLTQKCELLAKYKKGVMQQILSRELRFKDDDGQDFPEWQETTLDTICKPQQWQTISSSQLTESGYPAYGANGQIGYYSEYNHEYETVAVTCRGATCGEVSLIPPKSYITGNSMSLDEIDPAKNNHRFIYYALALRGFRDVISGSAQPQIVGSAIRKVELSKPSVQEQIKIANFLTALDDKLTYTQNQLAAVKQYKQGLLQQMFA